MATAFPIPVDHITCSVCFEIYRDPKQLQCLHTFCHQCIEQIKQGTNIECPECRKHTALRSIQKDFKTQSLEDWHKGQNTQKIQSNLQVIKLPSQCEVCNNPGKGIHSKCMNCDQFMCADCACYHTVIKVCKDHILKPITEIVKSIHKNVKESMKELEKEKKKVAQNVTSVGEQINKIEQCRKKQTADVNKYKEECMKQIEEFCMDLNTKIKQVNNEIIDNLKESEQHFHKILKELQEKINSLTKITEVHKLSLLSERANLVSSDILSEIKKITEKIPKVQSEMKSPVCVLKHAEWDVTKTVSVTIDGVVYTGANIRSHLQPLFTDMLKYNYQQSKEVQLNIGVQRLHMINDELWIAGSREIQIYDKNCQKIREITDEKIKGATGCAQIDNGDIVVSCCDPLNIKGELHQLDPGGKYIQQIAPGYFSDVAAFNNNIYAIDCKQNKINVYEQNNKWIQLKQIQLTFRNGDWWDKLCVKTTGIYISSANNHCLYHHNQAGEFICTIGKQGHKAPGNFNIPFISGIDKPGNVLVAEPYHQCLQIYTTDKTWHIVELHVDLPRDAVVDENADNFWIINSDGLLIRFSKV